MDVLDVRRRPRSRLGAPVPSVGGNAWTAEGLTPFGSAARGLEPAWSPKASRGENSQIKKMRWRRCFGRGEPLEAYVRATEDADASHGDR